jgi:hypothetical protein
MRKVQTMLAVSPHVRQRADVLALIRGESRAEIYRAALEGGGLAALEAQHADGLAELATLARNLGTTRTQLAEDALKEGHSLADIRALAE